MANFTAGMNRENILYWVIGTILVLILLYLLVTGRGFA